MSTGNAQRIYPKRARKVCAVLLEAAEALATNPDGVEVPHEHAEVAPVMWGLWRPATLLSRTILEQTDAGYTIETEPQIRTLLETVYTIMWLADYRCVAIQVLELKEFTEKHDLQKAMAQAKWEGAQDIDIGTGPDPQFTNDAEEKRFNKARHEKHNFADLVAAYEEPIYPIYKYLCGFTHAGPSMITAYLHEQSDGTLMLRPTGKSTDDAGVVATVLLLMQACRLFSRLLRGDPLKGKLERARMDLSLPPKYVPARRVPVA